MIGQPGEDVGKPRLRVEVVELGELAPLAVYDELASIGFVPTTSNTGDAA